MGARATATGALISLVWVPCSVSQYRNQTRFGFGSGNNAAATRDLGVAPVWATGRRSLARKVWSGGDGER